MLNFGRRTQPLPKPFADITRRQDPGTRKRVSRMMLEMSRDPNYSWNRPEPSAWQSFRSNPWGVIGPLLAGIAIAIGIIWMLHRYMTQGITPADTTRIVYVRNMAEVKELPLPLAAAASGRDSEAGPAPDSERTLAAEDDVTRDDARASDTGSPVLAENSASPG